jgi:hypothetical protein
MGTEDKTSLALVQDLATNLPAPVETTLVRALSNFLGGLTAIPAAWVKRPAQAIDDVTSARSAVAAILAKGVAEEALNDPIAMRAAAEIYLPGAIRKARNKVQVAHLAVRHTAEKAREAGSCDNAVPPSDDWLNAFSRFAEDASSEKLQDLYARILAGEVVNRGSFSLPTLRVVSELDQQTAADFALVWGRSVGEAVDYSAEFKRGEWFSRWGRLVEAGLMAPDATVQYLPDFNPDSDGYSMWTPFSVGDTFILVKFQAGASAQWPHIKFTRVGREVGSILAKPDLVTNMRAAGAGIAQHGLVTVDLFVAGNRVETLKSKPA